MQTPDEFREEEKKRFTPHFKSPKYDVRCPMCGYMYAYIAREMCVKCEREMEKWEKERRR